MSLKSLKLAGLALLAMSQAAPAFAQYYESTRPPPGYYYRDRGYYPPPPPPPPRYYEPQYAPQYQPRYAPQGYYQPVPYGQVCVTPRGVCPQSPEPVGNKCRCYIPPGGWERGGVQ